MNLGKWIRGGLRVALAVVPAGSIAQNVLTAAEAIEAATAVAGSPLKGQAKADAALNILHVIETLTDRDVLHDELVEEAIRKGFAAYASARHAEADAVAALHAIEAAVADAKQRLRTAA
jgi:hypothetical protein